jgi:predicted RNase H-like HicB family nuclease
MLIAFFNDHIALDTHNALMWNNGNMKRAFFARVWREGDWYVSQCLEVDIASQGSTEEEALENLKEALELYFEPPQATRPPKVRVIEVEVGAT